MRNSNSRFVFHIARKDGLPLFLHPFNDESFLLELGNQLEKGGPPAIAGLYGREPRIESLTLFRNDLYRLIEEHVERWMQEKRFIPRFLFSAVVFLLAYFFAAVVIRDPIPLLDEILIALGASIFAYVVLGKQIKKSDLATRRRIMMRDVVDKIVFQESALVHSVEDFLGENEGLAGEDLSEKLWTEEPAFAPGSAAEDQKEAAQLGELLSYLEKQFHKDLLKWHEKSLSGGRKAQGGGSPPKSKKIDLPLFFTYTKLKQFCKK